MKYPVAMILTCGLTVSSLFLCAPSQALDTVAISLGAGGTLNQSDGLDEASYFSFWAGALSSDKQRLGLYANILVPQSQVSDRSQDNNEYSLVSAGITYSATRHVSLYGGLGWSHQKVRGLSPQSSAYSDDKLNVNGGLLFHFTDRFGLNVGYDSAPNGINFGLTYKFN